MIAEIEGREYTLPDTYIWEMAGRVAEDLKAKLRSDTSRVYLPEPDSNPIVAPGRRVLVAYSGVSKEGRLLYTLDSGTEDTEQGLALLDQGGIKEGIMARRRYPHMGQDYWLVLSLKTFKGPGLTTLTYNSPTFDKFVEKFTNGYPTGPIRQEVVGRLRRRAVDLLKDHPGLGRVEIKRTELSPVIEHIDISGFFPRDREKVTKVFLELLHSMD